MKDLKKIVPLFCRVLLPIPAELPKGAVRDQAITAADWYPTLLELCGVKLPDVTLDGASLLPIILDNRPSHHEVMHWQWQNRWAVRKEDWKLIQQGKNVFLGNLSDAEPERKNYAEEEPGLVKELRALHEAWAREIAEERSK